MLADTLNGRAPYTQTTKKCHPITSGLHLRSTVRVKLSSPQRTGHSILKENDKEEEGGKE